MTGNFDFEMYPSRIGPLLFFQWLVGDRMSLSNDIFQSLSKGLSFQRKTNALAAEAIHKKANSKSSLLGGASLDYFGAKKKIATEKSSKPMQDEIEQESGSDNDDDDVVSLRKRLKIKVRGNGVPDLFTTFSLKALIAGHQEKKPMAELVLNNIETALYSEPTAIQMQAIPAMLQGRDLIGCAPTGSGKTAAFLIPIIMNMAESKKKSVLRTVILAPTRELASQILREFEKLSAGKHFHACVLRKSTLGNVKASIKENGAAMDLVVGTPSRLVHLLQVDAIDLSSVELLVMDEADKLFELGFLESIDEIIASCGAKTQRAMFSATIPPQIEEMAKSVLRDPVEVTVGTKNAGADTIDQQLMFVGQEQGKLIAIRQLVQQGQLLPPTLIFVQSKERAKSLHQELVYDGIKVEAIHAERTQAQRDDIVKRFRAGNIWLLICTDLMGRGIDFKGVKCVINYDFPTSAVSYIHRIGRTGRAGRSGKAITFFTLDDMEYLRSIANIIRLSGCEVPDYMLKLKKTNSNKRKALENKPPKRYEISTASKYDKQKASRKKNMVKQSKLKKQRLVSDE